MLANIIKFLARKNHIERRGEKRRKKVFILMFFTNLYPDELLNSIFVCSPMWVIPSFI